MLDIFYERVPRDHSFEHTVLLALEIIMADLSKLNDSVTANTQAVADVTAVVNALNSGSDQVGIDAAATQIGVNNAALKLLVPPPVTPPSS